jgi:aminoglycoside/choline kinase family phosphotransferase/dTDP-glucose pyrophosphorylase
MEVLKKLFEQHFHAAVDRVQPLQGELGGSGRSIIRLAGSGHSAIGILHDVREENVAFLEFSRHFRRHGLPVPEIYGEDLDHGAYLEEDLGDTTLFEFLSKNRTGENIATPVVEAYRKVVAVLPRFQIDAGRDLNYSVCYPRGSFDRQSISWDLNYFKYYFLKLAGIPFNEQALEDDFSRLTDFLLSAPNDYFLYRDFQSRNIMVREGGPFFVDYQGGRKGALQYDVASLLFDAKADLPSQLRQELLYYYLDQAAGYIQLDRAEFLEFYYAYVYVRILQALGAYGFRGFYERKTHFLQSVPYALKNLRWLLHNIKLPIALPTLMDAFHSMLRSEKLLSIASEAENLVVRIFSFSFHRGLPRDESGNGGGFIFDGRSLPNPGREERFKTLTGKDAPVIDYLNQQETVHQFLASVMSLVDASVSEYQGRGFKHLMVSFGCTGGQHRSVYLAEQVAKRLRGRNGVEVAVRHLGLESLGEYYHSQLGSSGEPRPAAATPTKAMILAAGLGTRLRPLTDTRPKALVEIGGRTLLEITLARLRSLGVREVVINVHHFADVVADYLDANKNFGMRIELSREEALLDTGGGLKKAAWFFLEGSGDQPFILHNVDVLSTIDLARMIRFHIENQALATLAVQERETSRYLLFDEQLQLCGRQSLADHKTEMVRSLRQTTPLAFSGIHVISPRLLPMLTEEGAFSIVTSYLRLAAQGEKIMAFRTDEYYWRDLGSPENIAQAEEDVRRGMV